VYGATRAWRIAVTWVLKLARRTVRASSELDYKTLSHHFGTIYYKVRKVYGNSGGERAYGKL